MKRDGMRHTVSQTMGRIGLDFCRVGESREFDGSIGLDRGKVPQAKVPRNCTKHAGVRGTSRLKILTGKMLSVRYGVCYRDYLNSLVRSATAPSFQGFGASTLSGHNISSSSGLPLSGFRDDHDPTQCSAPTSVHRPFIPGTSHISGPPIVHMDHALPRSRRPRHGRLGGFHRHVLRANHWRSACDCFDVSRFQPPGTLRTPKLRAGRRIVPKHPTAQAVQVTGTILPAKPNGTVPTMVAFGRDPHQRWRNCCRRPTPRGSS